MSETSVGGFVFSLAQVRQRCSGVSCFGLGDVGGQCRAMVCVADKERENCCRIERTAATGFGVRGGGKGTTQLENGKMEGWRGARGDDGREYRGGAPDLDDPGSLGHEIHGRRVRSPGTTQEQLRAVIKVTGR